MPIRKQANLFREVKYIYIYTHTHPGVELLDHMVVLFLVIWVVFIMFSIVIVPIFISTNSVKGFLFSASLPTFVIWKKKKQNICYLRYVWRWHSDRCEVLSHCCFNVFFSDDSWFWTSLHVCVGHLYVFCGKMSVQVFGPLIIGFFGLLTLNFVSCLYILAFNP